MTCPTPTTGGVFLSGVLNFLDCQAQTIGASGYQLLSAPGSAVSVALTALLTIFVALFGVRMLLGQTPTLRDGVVAMVKVGVVLLLATSWPAVRVLAYDVVLHAPADIVATLGSPHLPGAGGGLTARLQAVDDAIVALSDRGSGRGDVAVVQPVGMRASPVADDIALGGGRVAFLGSVIAALAAVRIGGGLLLAMTPLFAALLLFDTTRGAFLGWARALFATFLSAVAIAVVLGVELALIEPWLADVLAQRAANIATLAAPVELLVMALGFGIALFAVVALLTRIAFHQLLSVATVLRSEIAERLASPMPVPAPNRDMPLPLRDHDRAVHVADAIAAAQRREQGAAVVQTRTIAPTPTARGDGADVPAVVPLGQTWRRRGQRMSQGARRRDARR
ncbi:type IV secretion system protein [Sphingomonas silueang]|uniref:type IV secretion system protein n=1 Tax=Sphingomonas silueang TaxID=3156617 RepID=UPI0032B4E40C